MVPDHEAAAVRVPGAELQRVVLPDLRVVPGPVAPLQPVHVLEERPERPVLQQVLNNFERNN